MFQKLDLGHINGALAKTLSQLSVFYHYPILFAFFDVGEKHGSTGVRAAELNTEN